MVLVRKALNALVVMALVAVAGILLVAVLLPRVISAVPLTVLSGSMEPTLSAGDLIVTKPIADPNEVQVGDIVTFQPVSDNATLITHRVIDRTLSTGGTTFVTQGDANGAPDDPITSDQVMGTLVYTVPYVGHIAQAIPRGTNDYVLPVVGVVLLGYGAYALILGQRREKRKRADTRDPGQEADSTALAEREEQRRSSEKV